MHGNVWEWVEDCYHNSYEGVPTDGSAWTSGADCSDRVVRGGSLSNDPRYLRSAARGSVTTDVRVEYLGFRVGRTLTP
jgi:formylglycine-generating enzyme required for sulfatase activity